MPLLVIAAGQTACGAPGAGSDGCGAPATRIHELQGSGERSAHQGQRHVVEGVLTARFPGLRGFFLQEQPADSDDDPRTSEAVFVFEGTGHVDAATGALLRVSGEVREFESDGAVLTELVNPADAVVCGRGPEIPSQSVVLAPGTPLDWERLEGMRVTLEGVVTDPDELRRYGSVELAHERLMQPTQVAAPGEAARMRAQRDAVTRIALDDGSTQVQPRRAQKLRAGDRVRVVAGIVDQRFGRYRIQPTQALEIRPEVPPEEPPPLPGSLRIAAFNLRNWFHSLDDGRRRCGPQRDQRCRGARSEGARARQRRRLGAVLRGLDADLIGLAEVENGSREALEALRAELGPHYRAIETGALGGDVIRVAILYRGDRLRRHGDHAVLDARAEPDFDAGLHRPTLAQTFETRDGASRFTLAVNHWKSKGRACPGDPDRGDGQGRCNRARTRAASALLRWLARDPTHSGDPDFLIVGDLNSYRLEDPLRALTAAGYRDLLAHFVGPRAYTSAFEGRFGALDHALASRSLAGQVAGAAIWHINADEPAGFSASEASIYGSSDHDPVLIGLDLESL